MAGTIIADTIQATSQQISLNVGNTTILTASSTGLTLIPTTNVNINVTNSTVAFGSGNVTNPSISFSGNTSTGLYMPLANTLAFTTAGTEDMRITATGDVGIGTTSPSGKFHVESAGTNYIYTRNGSASGIAGVVFQNTTDTRSWRIDGTNLDAYDMSAGATRMRIDSGGQVLIATTSSTIGGDGGRLLIDAGASSLALLANRTGDGNIVRWYRTNVQVGSIGVTASATSYNTSSDYRLKQNIAPMTGALAKVALLKPVTYKWKLDGSNGQGFIAHELAEVVPDCVTGEKDALKKDGNPDYQGVDTSFLVATLTAAIQELKVIVDAQAVEIAALKAK
jgi:hypothetical protein